MTVGLEVEVVKMALDSARSLRPTKMPARPGGEPLPVRYVDEETFNAERLAASFDEDAEVDVGCEFFKFILRADSIVILDSHRQAAV